MAFIVEWVGPPLEVQVFVLIEVISDDESNPEIEIWPPKGVSTQVIRLEEFPPDLLASADGLLVSVTPEYDFWGSIAFVQKWNGLVKIDCEPISNSIRDGIWWAEAVGIVPSDNNGKGVRIGVIDGNIRRDTTFLERVQYLGHATLGSFSADDRHGTLVASFIAGRSSECIVPGLASGAELVFISAADREGYLSPNAVADGIEILSEDHGCDIIVVSAGDSETPQPHIKEAVIRARSTGSICLFAAGNESAKVNFPAKYPEVVAVGACGKFGALPKNSRMCATFEGDDGRCTTDSNGNYYLSEWLAYGNEIDLIAPGIGLVADVGDGHLYPVAGTSFAAPIAACVLAVALAGDSYYAGLSGGERFCFAAEALEKNARNGVFPEVPFALGFACVTIDPEPSLDRREKVLIADSAYDSLDVEDQSSSTTRIGLDMSSFLVRLTTEDAERAQAIRSLGSRIESFDGAIEVIEVGRRAYTIRCGQDVAARLSEVVRGLATVDSYEGLRPL